MKPGKLPILEHSLQQNLMQQTVVSLKTCFLHKTFQLLHKDV